MTFTKNQKNIIIDCTDKCTAELTLITNKITSRRNQFIRRYGGIIRPIETDLTKMSMKELQTMKKILSKMRSEVNNVESHLLYELQKTDAEMVKRNG